MSRRGKTRPSYPQAFRDQMVRLVRSGRSPESLAAEFEPTPCTIRKWVKAADAADGVGQGDLDANERAELQRLRRENRKLRMEREILAKATAWFARETLPESSDS